MAKKKKTPPITAQGDSAQVQQTLAHYHQIAGDLHKSSDRKQAETALAEINGLSEGTQMALLKALTTQRHSDAADLLAAMHELSPLKNVRKEAKRALLRMAEAKIYPTWEPAGEPLPVVQDTSVAAGFWKGMMTDSHDLGEMQLVLSWELENNPDDVRVLVFLLEFWHDGVKDFFTNTQSKRSFERMMEHMNAELSDVAMKECSLAQGRRFVREALEVNRHAGTQPGKDYRFNAGLVEHLVLSAPVPDEEEEEEDFDEDADFAEVEGEDEDSEDLHGLSPDDVVMRFVEAWCDAEYETAYELLAQGSSLREDLALEEWVERRETWMDAAHPADFEPVYILEREVDKSRLWLPKTFVRQQQTARKEFETSWSLELDEMAGSIALPELAEALVVNEETNRHWFWVTYSLVQEGDEWRIQSMVDESVNTLTLSVDEVVKRIKEQNTHIESITKKHSPNDSDALQYMEEVLQHQMQAANYTDILLKLIPEERYIYEQAAKRMFMYSLFERGVVYLEQALERFDEQREPDLRQLAQIRQALSQKYSAIGDDERRERFLALAEEALKEAMTIEDTADAHISLADVFIEDDRLDEAEEHLLKAKALASDPADEAHIEMHLGQIASAREQYEEALRHHQRVADLRPDLVDSWLDLARAYEDLDDIKQAEASYKRAIALKPDHPDAYELLGKLYTDRGQRTKAYEILEDALDAYPDSTSLNFSMATLYMEDHDYEQADVFLSRAEHLDPGAEDLIIARATLNIIKKQMGMGPKGLKSGGPLKLSRPKKKKR